MAKARTARAQKIVAALAESFGSVATAALVGGVVALIAAGVVRLVGERLTASYLTLLAVGLLLLLAAAATGYEAIRRTLVSRRGFYGVNTTVMILLFLAIASVIVYVGTRTNARFDTTSAREFSLAQQTVKILKDLKQEVEAVAFFKASDPNQVLVRAPAEDLLEEYAQASRRFSYRVRDPDLFPEEARRYGINADTEPGTIVFASEGNLQPVKTLIFTQQGQFVKNENMEKDFSQAILAVSRARQKVVYFLVRHGEGDANNLTEGNGYGLARRGLERDNYLVRTLDLGASEARVPEDAAALIIAGPRNDLLEQEARLLDEYLRKGGKALFLLDPDTPQGFRNVLRTWGADLGEGTVVDLGSSVSGAPRAPLVTRARYSFLARVNPPVFSPITQPVTDSTFFERSTAIIPLENQGKDVEPPLPNVFYSSRNLLITPLAVTTEFFSWLKKNPEVDRFEDGDLRGPLALGVSIDARAPFKEEPSAGAEQPRTQIVVFGDSDFGSNRFFSSFANGDLFLNAVNWLAGDVDLIAVRPKLREPRLLIVTRGTFNFIRWSSLLILPVAVAAAGGIVWWRRR